MTRDEILAEAEKNVCGQRTHDYGEPEDNFAVIARFWNVYLEALDYSELTPRDVANMMALLKIARNTTGKGTMDCWIDLAGYAACGGEIASREAGHE